jgi:DME family drug/metabolite transporter
MSLTSVAVAVLTHSFAPIFVALAAPFIDGQRVRGAAMASIVAVSGIGLVLRPWEVNALQGDVQIGAAFGLLSALAYATNVFLSRRLTIAIGAARTMGLHAFGAALLLLPLAITTPSNVELLDIGVLAFAAVVLGVGANIAFVRGLVVIGAARAAVLALLEPLVACLVGWLVWEESLDRSALFGAVLILGAGILVARAGREPSATTQEP